MIVNFFFKESTKLKLDVGLEPLAWLNCKVFPLSYLWPQGAISVRQQKSQKTTKSFIKISLTQCSQADHPDPYQKMKTCGSIPFRSSSLPYSPLKISLCHMLKSCQDLVCRSAWKLPRVQIHFAWQVIIVALQLWLHFHLSLLGARKFYNECSIQAFI